MPRRVISFIGGIDLCDGRYDTHDHPLFRTLQLEHKRDFYQDCIGGVDGEAGGKNPAAALAFLFQGPYRCQGLPPSVGIKEAGGESCTALSPAAGLCLIDAEVPLISQGWRANNFGSFAAHLTARACTTTTASP